MKDKAQSPIVQAIRELERSTELQYSSASQVHKAFLLGLWYRSIPEYMLNYLGTLYSWDLTEIDPEAAKSFDGVPPNSFKFQFISDTGDSWHQCYRDLRRLGWRRLKVHRKGGILQYLFRISEGRKGQFPQGFGELHLLLQISIATCRQVQVGTEIKEVPIMETVCEDLVDLPEESPAAAIASGVLEQGETVELVVVPDVEKVLEDSEPRISEVDLSAQGGPDVGEPFEDSIPF